MNIINKQITLNIDESGNLIFFIVKEIDNNGPIYSKSYAAADTSLQSIMIEANKLFAAFEAEKGIQ